MNTPTIAGAARRIAANELSPVELTRHCLDRIAALDSTFHAFLAVTEDRALADAAASEVRARAGTRLGPLDGIPIAHKDVFATAGIATTGHSRQLAGAIPERNAAVVERLERAGAVMLGKLNCYEFAFAGPAYDLPWPPSRNPWDVTRSTAGSSSRSAAAVALGLALGATGSDTGGSVRDPAALCGVVGLKPTYGRCPRDGMLPFAWSLDHPGPIAWTAEDCALLLQAMAGGDFTTTIGGGVDGLRIGVVRHWHEAENPVSAATHSAIDYAVTVLGGLGATIREVTLPPLRDYHACGWTIALSELRAAHEHRLRRGDAGRYGSLLRQGLALGGTLGAGDYVQATRRRRELCRTTARAMRDVDLLLTAAQDGEAPAMREALGTLPFEKPNFAMPFNVTGQPAISLCTGYGVGGLPVAMQLAANPFDDALLVRAAHAYEAATPWREARPHAVT